MNNNERAERFLRRSLEGVASEEEIDQMVFSVKRISRLYNTSIFALMQYILKGYSRILKRSETEMYLRLMGENN